MGIMHPHTPHLISFFLSDAKRKKLSKERKTRDCLITTKLNLKRVNSLNLRHCGLDPQSHYRSNNTRFVVVSLSSNYYYPSPCPSPTRGEGIIFFVRFSALKIACPPDFCSSVSVYFPLLREGNILITFLCIKKTTHF